MAPELVDGRLFRLREDLPDLTGGDDFADRPGAGQGYGLVYGFDAGAESVAGAVENLEDDRLGR